MGILRKSLHTHKLNKPLIYSMHRGTKENIRHWMPSSKQVSWSDLPLLCGAVVAECSDVALIHHCQHSHTQSRHTYKLTHM